MCLVIGSINTAGKDEIVYSAATSLEPSKDASPGWLQKLELNRSAGLLLDDDRSGANLAANYKISDLDFDDVARSLLLSIARSNNARSRSLRGMTFSVETGDDAIAG